MAAAISGHGVPNLALVLAKKEGIPLPGLRHYLVPTLWEKDRAHYPVSEEAWASLKNIRNVQGCIGFATLVTTVTTVATSLIQFKMGLHSRWNAVRSMGHPNSCVGWNASPQLLPEVALDLEKLEPYYKAVANLHRWIAVDKWITPLMIAAVPVVTYISYKIFSALHQYFRKAQFEEVQKRLTSEIKEAAAQLHPEDVNEFCTLYRNADALRENLEVMGRLDIDTMLSPLDNLIGMFPKDKMIVLLDAVNVANAEKKHLLILKNVSNIFGF